MGYAELSAVFYGRPNADINTPQISSVTDSHAHSFLIHGSSSVSSNQTSQSSQQTPISGLPGSPGAPKTLDPPNSISTSGRLNVRKYFLQVNIFPYLQEISQICN